MDEKKRKIIRYASGWFLATMTVLCGALLMGQAIAIFNTGSYSREKVGRALLQILAPLIVYILAIIAGYVLCKLFPMKEKRDKISPRYTLRRLEARAETDKASEQYAPIARIKLIKNILWGVCAAVVAVVTICVIVYLADTANYEKTDVNGTMYRAFVACFPWIAAAFLVCIGVDVWSGAQVKKLIDFYKSQPLSRTPVAATGALPQAAAKAETFFNSRAYILTVRIVLAVLAVAFIIWGAFNGGARDVLRKAINICTECIGLG